MKDKLILFDAGTLICFSMNGLFPELRNLRKIFQGKFIITKEVKYEIIDRPLDIQRFELEAKLFENLLRDGVLEMPDSIGISNEEVSKKTEEILGVSNEIFQTKNGGIHIIDRGEASILALNFILKEKKIDSIIAVDERATRQLGESLVNLKGYLQSKLHTKITIKKELENYFKGIKFIRSTELIYVAWKKNLTRVEGKSGLNALLYAMKNKGSAISSGEIREILSLAK
jgi:hypothetical protein